MDRKLIYEYVNCLKTMEDKKYIYSIIKYNIAAVLEGVKPAALITLPSAERPQHILWDIYKYDIYSNLCVDFIELNRDKGKVSILFYNYDYLKYIIYDEAILDFLMGYGYSRDMNLFMVLEHLKERFTDGCPHEIGMFLGIPLDEVKAFIDSNGEKSILTGYWKVYNDKRRAEKIFELYDNIKEKTIIEILNTSQNLNTYI